MPKKRSNSEWQRLIGYDSGKRAAEQSIPLTDTDYLLEQTNDVRAYWKAHLEYQRAKKRQTRNGR